MRLVLDTKSKAWGNFVRILGGVCILMIIITSLVLLGILIKTDLDFVIGYASALHITKYKWRV